jgi:HlyD family secretion protein
MQKKITPRKIIYIAVITGFCLLLYFWIRSCSRNVDVVYRYEEAVKGDVMKSISVTGKLEVYDAQMVLSRIGGIVNSIYTDFNKNVARGQLLAVIDATEVEHKILRAERMYERAKLDLEEVRRTLDGKNELLREKLISKREMEVAELNFQKVQSQYRQTKLEYEIAMQERSFTRITAPVSGVVISREVEPRGVYGPGKVFFVIAETLRKMRLMINVDESDIGNIKTGQNVSFTVSAYPEKKFAGIISQVRINPVVQGAVVTYQSVVICENEELLLKPGMTATATIVVGDKKNVLRVPNQAFIVSPVKMQEVPGKKFIWKKQAALMKDLPVARVEVVTGLMGDQYTEITGGKLSAGDQVLVSIQKHFETKDELSGYGK